MADGSSNTVPLVFKDKYTDEYTTEALPHGHICEAMADEIRYLMDHALLVVPAAEAQSDPEGKLVGGRWVNSNKQDATNPKCTGRFVAQEIGFGADENFYAATPPLDAKRLLFS